MNMCRVMFQFKKPRGQFGYLSLFYLWLIFGVFITADAWAQSDGRTVRVGVYQNAPQVFIEEDGSPRGIYIDILKEIAKKENWHLKFIVGTFSKHLEAIRTGQLDIMTSIAATPERKIYSDFSNETIISVWGQLYVQQDFSPQNIFDMANRKVAVMRGGVLGQGFDKLCRDFNVTCQIVPMASYEQALQAVDDGIVDAAVVNSILGFSRETKYKAIRSSFVFSPVRLLIAVPKGQNGDLTAAVDQHLKGWRKDKKSFYYKTLDRWLGLKPVETSVMPSWIWWVLVTGGGAILLTFIWNSALHEQIAKRKEAEKTLQREHDLFRSSINSLPGIFYMINQDQKFEIWNQNFLQVSKYSEAEISNLSPLDFFATDEKPAITQGIQTVMEKREATGEASLVAKDGSKHPFFFSGTKVEIDGKPRLIGTGIDISERKHLEEQIRRSQKMEAVGYLTGGIAHDFNNILGIVLGNLELLERIVKDNPKALPRVEKAIKGTKRGAALTNKLLRFSRKKAQGTKLLSVSEFIDDLEELIVKSLTAAIKVESNLSEDLWSVSVDPGDLEDTILNLAINARDAMPEGGTLKITTANITLDENHVRLNPGSTTGDYVMISLSDTGQGMSNEVKDQIFEPFYTTKQQGKGTGLGLSMVYGFIQRCNGHIDVQSKVGIGTTFNIYVPAFRQGTPAEITPSQSSEEILTGNETVLVVDDEEALRDIAVSNLEESGYTTLTAENGLQALEILKENNNIDLMFSDIIMPGNFDGYQLAAAAHQEYPGLKILLASGFTSKQEGHVEIKNPYILDLDHNLLSKPYNQWELSQAVRQALDKQI